MKYPKEPVPIDWEKIPELSELEISIGFTLGYYEKEELSTKKPKVAPRFKLSKEEYILHKEQDIEQIKKLYEENGFDTNLILQDPTGHKGPTVACPIGFPIGLPFPHEKMMKFNRWICRVHVDISRVDEGIVSVPHVEPDPKFHPWDHLWDTYIKKRVVRGAEAVSALNYLGIR